MKARPDYMPPEQFKQVLDSIHLLHLRKFKVEDVQMFFKICYWLGLRFNEALKLTVEDFDFSINKVWLGTTKANKSDTALIPELFKSELVLYLDGKEGKIFPKFSYITCIKWIEKLGKMLNIQAWTTSRDETGQFTKTHIFRKSIGKDMTYGTFGNKAPLNFVSKALRHKGRNPLATTIKYLNVGEEELDDWWKDKVVE